MTVKDSVGQVNFSNYKYPVPIKQMRLIDYFAGIAMLGEVSFNNITIRNGMKEVVEKSYVIAKMMVEESKKYEDNA
jgi:hypothetical protein